MEEKDLFALYSLKKISQLNPLVNNINIKIKKFEKTIIYIKIYNI